MRKLLVFLIPLALLVAAMFQFACGGGGGATIPDATYDPAYAPRNLHWEPGNESIIFRWDPVPFAVGYRVYLSEDGNVFKLHTGSKPIAQTQITITELSNGKQYYVGVSAVGSSVVESAMSYPGGAPDAQPIEPTGVVIPPYEGNAPAPPKNLQGYSGDSLVHLDWDENTEPDFAGYVVSRAREAISGDGPGDYSNLPWTLNNLYDDNNVINGQTYYYYVRAYDLEEFFSEPSNRVKYTPQSSPPLQPAAFKAFWVELDGVVRLNWTRSKEPDIKAYRIIRYDFTEPDDVNPVLDTAIIYLVYPGDGSYPPYDDVLIEREHVYMYELAAQDIEEQWGPPALSENVLVPGY
jgi:hypothetical protein